MYSTQLHQRSNNNNATAKKYDNRREVMRSFQGKLLLFYLLPFPDLLSYFYYVPHTPLTPTPPPPPSSSPAARVYLSLFSYLPRAGAIDFQPAIKVAPCPVKPPTLSRAPFCKLASIVISSRSRFLPLPHIFLQFTPRFVRGSRVRAISPARLSPPSSREQTRVSHVSAILCRC